MQQSQGRLTCGSQQDGTAASREPADGDRPRECVVPHRGDASGGGDALGDGEAPDGSDRSGDGVMPGDAATMRDASQPDSPAMRPDKFRLETRLIELGAALAATQMLYKSLERDFYLAAFGRYDD